jgi:hypothetical protein
MASLLPRDQDQTPPIFAPIDTESMDAGQMPQKPMQIFAPAAPQPVGALDQIEQPQQARLSKLQWQDTHPWGTAENHPGTAGKIAHVLSVAGNIAGDIFAPAAMAVAPGTELGRRMEENHLTSGIEGIEKQKSESGLQGAEQAKDVEETAEAPAAAKSKEALEGAQAGEAGARTKTLENPPEEWKAIPTLTGPNGEPVEIESKTGNIRFGGVQGTTPTKQPRPDSPEQQYIDEYQRMHKGSTVAEAERQYALDTQRPAQAPVTNILIPDGNGGYKVQGATAGSTIAPGAVTPAGMNTLDTPTSQTRNMAEMAKTVLPMATSVTQEVNDLAQSVGPAVGRWNQLMTNKGGADFPEFAGLDTDLDLLASAIVRTHFGARGGQQYREELRKMFGEAQSPDDLVSRISHADGWLEGYAHMADRGNVTPGAPTQEPSRPAGVGPDWTYNANGPKGAGWYAPTKPAK